jgi:hypothetical protein
VILIRLPLLGQMGVAGKIAADTAGQQARNSGPVQALAAQLEALR